VFDPWLSMTESDAAERIDDSAEGERAMGKRADFDSPPPLGTTDRSRYVKLTTLEEAEGPETHEWIERAGRVPGWKYPQLRPQSSARGSSAG
jgi:hypothetical protein